MSEPEQVLPCPLCRCADVSVLAEIGQRRYYRCRQCEATFLDPAQLPTPEQERRRYDQHNNDPGDAGYRQFLGKLAGPLTERLSGMPGAKGLDFGCGPTPALALLLQEQGLSVASYDPFYRPDRAVLLDGAYNFVTASEVVEHLHHPREEFLRLKGFLKPGGLLAVMTEFQTDDSRFAGWYYRQDPTHVIFYREATMRWIAAHLLKMPVEIPRKNVAIFTKVPPGM